MKVLIVIALALAVATASVLHKDEEWKAFKKAHKKHYKPSEETFRHKIYKENKKNIEAHNARFENGEVTYKRGVNQFTDMLSHEVAEMLNGYKSGVRKYDATKAFVKSDASVPDTVDWRKEGYVTAIKNQGQCGCCWAFSTTGSLEGQLFKKTGNLVSLSEQNLVDCSTENDGCGGGLMDAAFAYVQQNGGIDTEESYPFQGQASWDVFGLFDHHSCRYKSANSAGTDSGYVDVSQGDEDALKEAVATIGPVSVAIDASHDSFQTYSSGVYVESACSSSSLDHGVLVVGYGTENGQDYWLVKNSWGTTWGEEGYIKMARNLNNQCGVASEASYPTV